MHPYNNLPEKAFWKTAVATNNPFDIHQLWAPKYNIRPSHKVATFGSCFAQHIGKALHNRGYSWLRTEVSPTNLIAKETFNYDVFSCRTGNIYTTSLLRQWVDWTVGTSVPPEEYWEKDGRIYDPFRPRIEPNGFASVAKMQESRDVTLKAMERVITEANIFVFTLGLTESWMNADAGYEYPMCPGTVAGEFNDSLHSFKNQNYSFVRQQLMTAVRSMRILNPKLRVILTVSPVPLTATKSGEHVLVASTHSKSVLRAVAGELCNDFPYIDYFPSYEIINSAPFKGMFFEQNQRSVNHRGVSFVMDSFFQCQEDIFGKIKRRSKKNREHVKRLNKKKDSSDVICEEELLEAFSENV